MRIPKKNDNEIVTLCLEDVTCPELDVVMSHMTSDARVVGTIRFLSAGRNSHTEFAIVEAPGVKVPLVVPLEKLRPLRKQTDQLEPVNEATEISQELRAD